MGARIATNTSKLRMTTEILTLTQLLSPSFPVGAFAYSHGLEAAILSGTITDAHTLENWLESLLSQGSARADAVLLRVAYAANPADVELIDATARAFAASKERLLETDLQGAAFCDTFAAVWGVELGALTYPVAVGRAARHIALDAELTTAMYLHAFVANLCGAAMRLVPLGQTDGQRVQAALKPLCASLGAEMQDADLDDLHSNPIRAGFSHLKGLYHVSKRSIAYWYWWPCWRGKNHADSGSRPLVPPTAVNWCDHQ
jgi:urease accessory protein